MYSITATHGYRRTVGGHTGTQVAMQMALVVLYLRVFGRGWWGWNTKYVDYYCYFSRCS